MLSFKITPLVILAASALLVIWWKRPCQRPISRKAEAIRYKNLLDTSRELQQRIELKIIELKELENKGCPIGLHDLYELEGFVAEIEAFNLFISDDKITKRYYWLFYGGIENKINDIKRWADADQERD